MLSSAMHPSASAHGGALQAVRAIEAALVEKAAGGEKVTGPPPPLVPSHHLGWCWCWLPCEAQSPKAQSPPSVLHGLPCVKGGCGRRVLASPRANSTAIC